MTVDELRQELDEESRATRRVLERIPEDRLSWKPHPRSMSMGQHAMPGRADGHARAEPRHGEGDPRRDGRRGPRATLHHRAQLLVYLRLVGAKVPAVYGASADENPMAS